MAQMKVLGPTVCSADGGGDHNVSAIQTISRNLEFGAFLLPVSILGLEEKAMQGDRQS